MVQCVVFGDISLMAILAGNHPKSESVKVRHPVLASEI